MYFIISLSLSLCRFPLFTAVYRICMGVFPVHRLVETLRFAREDM